MKVLEKPKTIWIACKKHEFVLKDGAKRELVCKKCGFVQPFVLGRDNEYLKKLKIIK